MRKFIALMSLASLVLGGSVKAVTLYSTGDPNSHTTAPTGSFSNSGWQYQGNFSVFSGTAIGPHAFITATHTGPHDQIGNSFNYNGTNYTILSSTQLPGRDLSVVTVSGLLPYWAPIYNPATDGSLVGKTTIFMGRGTERGGPVNVSTSRPPEGTLRGWFWGAETHVRRWGTNVITDLSALDPSNDSPTEYFRFTFDQNGLTDEAVVSAGDSGGGAFVQGANGVWKLSGVNAAVEAFFRFSPSDAIDVAGTMFDFSDLYLEASDHTYHLAQEFYPGQFPIPATGYTVNVSDVPPAQLATYLPRAGDANVNGVIDSTDFSILAAHFNMTSGAVWLDGDFNFDGKVNALDFNALASNFGQTYTLVGATAPALAAAVPEPASGALLGCAALVLARRRSRR